MDIAACTTTEAIVILIQGVLSKPWSGPLTAHQQNDRKPMRPAIWNTVPSGPPPCRRLLTMAVASSPPMTMT